MKSSPGNKKCIFVCVCVCVYVYLNCDGNNTIECKKEWIKICPHMQRHKRLWSSSFFHSGPQRYYVVYNVHLCSFHHQEILCIYILFAFGFCNLHKNILWHHKQTEPNKENKENGDTLCWWFVLWLWKMQINIFTLFL